MLHVDTCRQLSDCKAGLVAISVTGKAASVSISRYGIKTSLEVFF